MTTKSKQRQGAALVIVLAFIVLLTGLVMAFFSQAMSNRNQSNSSFNQTKVDELARSALDIITGDLKQEIVNGSTTLPNPNPSQYPVVLQPTSPSNINPKRTLTTPLGTLIRTSSDAAVQAPAVDHSASDAPSTVSSANGRAITPQIWNRHYLLPRPTNAAATDTTPEAAFNAVVPKWVYVTTQGPTFLSTPPAATAPQVIGRYAYAIYDTSGLLDANVAGYPVNLPLVDAYPAPVPPKAPNRFGYGAKGAATFANLTQLLPTTIANPITQDQVDTLVGWRNYASIKPGGIFPDSRYTISPADRETAASFFDTIISNSNGFLKVDGAVWNSQTNKTFLSRQQLIDFWLAGNINPSALRYLSTFSRAAPIPSWRPSTPTGSTIDYAAIADEADSPNRDLLKLRHPTAATITHYNDDGTTYTYDVQPGDLGVQKRFSLAKLAWLTYKGPSASLPDSDPLYNAGGTPAAIQACFGLVWVPSTNTHEGPYWDYVAATPPPAPRVKVLAEVVAEGREPNFFEMLKAGILSGSLGKDPGDQTDAVGLLTSTQSGTSREGPAGMVMDYSANKDRHLIQIGANIVDQADSDSYPTAVHFKYFQEDPSLLREKVYNTLYGNENLPYAMRLFMIPAERPAGRMSTWLQPEIWNPHQPLATGTGGSVPTQFRTRVYGEAYTTFIFATNAGGPQSPTRPTAPPPIPVIYDASSTPNDAGTVYFRDQNVGTSISPFYNNPIALRYSASSAYFESNKTPALNYYTGTPVYPRDQSDTSSSTNNFAGVWCGDVARPATSTGGHLGMYFVPLGFTFTLECFDGDSWRPYSFVTRIDTALNSQDFNDGAGQWLGKTKIGTGPETNFFDHVDPRTDRFSVTSARTNAGFGPPPNFDARRGLNTTQEPDNTNPFGTAIFWPRRTSGFTYVRNTPITTPTVGAFGISMYPVAWMVNRESPVVWPGPSSNWNANAYYSDPDGLVRPGDSIHRGGANGEGRQLAHASFSNYSASALSRRPVILNRPFRSVGELGYAYRDLPFKTIDFFSQRSADAGLLDLFDVKDQPSVVAGYINPNTAPAEVLQAMLMGALQREKNPNEPATANPVGLDKISATQMAATISQYAQTTPFTNPADLVTQLGTNGSTDFANAGVIQKAIFESTASDTIKAAHRGNNSYLEAPVRALASVSNFRTWNLMIDVIAQSGSIPRGAQSIGSDFVVQGEKRYWLHIAIDRFTNKVVDQHLEPVYD